MAAPTLSIGDFVRLVSPTCVRIIKYYVICCSSYDTLVEIERAPLLQHLVGNFLFAFNFAIIRRDRNSFIFVTIAQLLCWSMTLLNMPMVMALFTSALLLFSESYRYYHFMILSSHWAKLAACYCVEHSVSEMHQLIVFLIVTSCSYALLPIIRDINNVCLYVTICYYVKFLYTETPNFTVYAFDWINFKWCRILPIMQGLLLCSLLVPREALRIRDYIHEGFLP